MDKYDAYRAGRLSVKFPSVVDRLTKSYSVFGNPVLDTYFEKGRREEMRTRAKYILDDYYESIRSALDIPGAGEKLRSIFDATPKELADAANRGLLEDTIKRGLSTIPEFNGWDC